MKRLAVLVGSNGAHWLRHRLRYAVADTHRLARALKGRRCGFAVTKITQTSKPLLVKEKILDIAEQADADDFLLFYFAGHGIILDGRLHLMLDGSDDSSNLRKIRSSLSANELFRAIGLSRAQNKLLILDCCNAGGVAWEAGFRGEVSDVSVDALGLESNQYQILMASGWIESARELDTLKAGFLTSNSVKALTIKFRDADFGHDGLLGLDDLTRWLKSQAEQHNARYPNLRVPIPKLLGHGQGRLFLTITPGDWVPFYIDLPFGCPQLVILPLLEC